MIAIVGGTGPEGRGLGIRWAMAGERVAIGSRSEERGQQGAASVKEVVSDGKVEGGSNEVVVNDADFVVIAVPYDAVTPTVSSMASALRGKVVVSVVASLDWTEGRPRPINVPAGSVAEKIAQIVPDARITSGFHTLSAEKLADPHARLDEDTIICGDDRDSRHAVMALAERIDGIRAISGGRLSSSRYAEQFVGMLAILNRIHKTDCGLRIVDVT